MLLTMTCPRLDEGWLAEELVKEQTIENLNAFGRRLALAEEVINTKLGTKAREKAVKDLGEARTKARGY